MYWFVLTTYHSQLVLVGGVEYVGENVLRGPTYDKCTNKLWTLNEDCQWQETLPPMPVSLCNYGSAVSHGDNILVITREYCHPYNNMVYVYNGHHWASAQHPPLRLYSVTSTVFNGHWYVMGDSGITYSAFLDSLLASSCQPSEILSSLWKRLTFILVGLDSPVVFGNRLVSVKAPGVHYNTISLYAYSPGTESWVEKGDTPLMTTST